MSGANFSYAYLFGDENTLKIMISLEIVVLRVPLEVWEAGFDPYSSRLNHIIDSKVLISTNQDFCHPNVYSGPIFWWYLIFLPQENSMVFLDEFWLLLVWSCWWGLFGPQNGWKFCLYTILY